jgi:hypothetical protein
LPRVAARKSARVVPKSGMNRVSPTNAASAILLDRSAGVWPGVYRASTAEFADLEGLAVGEQPVEIAAIGTQDRGIDYRGAGRHRIGHQIADRVGGLVEKGSDHRGRRWLAVEFLI